MKNKVLPHSAIVLSGMYVVFYCIDRVNQPMAFIDNEITKALLLILSLISIANAIHVIRLDRIFYRQRQARPREAARPASARPRSAWDAPTRPSARTPRERRDYSRPQPARRRDDWRYS